MGPQYYSSPVAQKSSGPDKKFLILIIFVVLAALIGMAMLVFGKSSDAGDLLPRAVVRQQNLLKMTQDAQKEIRSGDLLKINSDARLFLTSDLALLQQLSKEAGQKGPTKEVVAAEADSVSAKRLSDAALSGRYDSAYITVMSQKIDSQQALLREIFTKAETKSIKEGASTVYNKLENIQKQLSDLQK